MAQKQLTYEAGKAYLEIGDNLYIVAEQLGLPEKWAASVLRKIAQDAKEKTGVDLTKA